MIEEMRAEFDRDAIELFERMRQQQQFALGIDRAALNALGVPVEPISTRRLAASTFM